MKDGSEKGSQKISQKISAPLQVRVSSVMGAAFRFAKSLQLAVAIIIGIGIVSAVGTVIEARYDTDYANRLVYQSPWMYTLYAFLSISLIAVMVDRWPWKRRHASFLLAHIGILMMLVGAWVTQQHGLDGSLAFEVGESTRYVMTSDREIAVYVSQDGNSMIPLARQNVDFLRRPPTAEKPLTIPIGSQVLTVKDYYHYAIRESEIVASEKAADGPALRFQLVNDRVNTTQWLRLAPGQNKAQLDLGPAKVTLSSQGEKPSGTNEILLAVDPANEQQLKVEIFTKSQGQITHSSVIKEGDVLATGWMGLQFRVLRYLPKSFEKVEFLAKEFPNKQTTSAMQVSLNGVDHWIGLNSVLRVFLDNQMTLVRFGNKQIDIGFDLKLEKFHVGHYQGTRRAATYESDVQVPDMGLVKISMNEPLKYKGFTFYQSSYEQNDQGEAIASILSVNVDPGRYIKYLGSLVLVFGSILLFAKKWRN